MNHHMMNYPIKDITFLIRRVTSIHNPVIQLVRTLARRRERYESGLFIAEGTNIVASGRDCGWVPRFLLVPERTNWSLSNRRYSRLISWAMACGALCLKLPESIFIKIATRDCQESMIGIFTQRWDPLPLAPNDTDIWVVLENIRDPGNLGTIIRTSAAVGVRGIILVGFCCDPYTRESVRATMGSIFHVSLVRVNCELFQHWMITWPGEVLGTHLTSSKDFRQRYHKPVLLLMGNEGSGLSSTLSQFCTSLVRIPMADRIDSLNLSIATSLMLYEIQRSIF